MKSGHFRASFYYRVKEIKADFEPIVLIPGGDPKHRCAMKSRQVVDH
jgi:hypothetical protein